MLNAYGSYYLIFLFCVEYTYMYTAIYCKIKLDIQILLHLSMISEHYLGLTFCLKFLLKIKKDYH